MCLIINNTISLIVTDWFKNSYFPFPASRGSFPAWCSLSGEKRPLFQRTPGKEPLLAGKFSTDSLAKLLLDLPGRYWTVCYRTY